MEFPAVGYRTTSGTLYYAGEYGRYWSSVTYTSNTGNAYDLTFGSGHLGVGSYSKQHGFSVRCVR
ncbi:MAG: fibrobacter succinogenes major paralogous domain-containing protein [Rikenellaceae bacterium]|nr:fibrobacter succinogenes major paralogous domain-containing protein [Rikenellaceae bacterium]MDE7356045.1 fibrobacter succinogenes major paralogous domain-containing protein [Rikenellaceae bacterium]